MVPTNSANDDGMMEVEKERLRTRGREEQERHPVVGVGPATWKKNRIEEEVERETAVRFRTLVVRNSILVLGLWPSCRVKNTLWIEGSMSHGCTSGASFSLPDVEDGGKPRCLILESDRKEDPIVEIKHVLAVCVQAVAFRAFVEHNKQLLMECEEIQERCWARDERVFQRTRQRQLNAAQRASVTYTRYRRESGGIVSGTTIERAVVADAPAVR